jgi:hypothetical protein
MDARAALAVVVAAALAGCGGSQAGWADEVDNPWFPLKPGTTLRYEGTDAGARVVDVFTVTRRRKTIQGVATTVVRDRLYRDGRLAEDTTDWYAQDAKGNVWYFGEATKELDETGRVVSRDGSWQAGVDGAKRGLFMPAKPRVGQSYRQEYYAGHAEDHFKITAIDGDTLRTIEWSPLERAVLDAKYYKKGVGTIREQSIAGGREQLELVSGP